MDALLNPIPCRALTRLLPSDILEARMKPSPLVRELTSIAGLDAVLWRAEDLMLYEYDALSSLRAPDAVVFPTSAEHVIGIVRLAAKEKVPVIARGAGTGLSGGAVVAEGGIVVSFARALQSRSRVRRSSGTLR